MDQAFDRMILRSNSYWCCGQNCGTISGSTFRRSELSLDAP